MSIGVSFRAASAWEPVRVIWANSSGWKPVKRGYWNSGAGWDLFYVVVPIVTVSPASVTVTGSFHFTPPSTDTWTINNPSASVTASASGGIGPYTYSWTATSGWNINSPGSQTTSFNCPTSFTAAPPPGGTATVTVTDSATGLQTTATVALNFSG